MNPDSQKAEHLFEAARQLDTSEQQAAFLQSACGENNELRQRVLELLRAAEEAGTFLQSPAETVFVSVVAGTQDLTKLAEKEGDRIGRYKLLQQIGEGGCGVVYMAEQEEPVRRRVALKVIKLGMDTKQVVARFEAERQALALMDHPNIAKVLDAGATEKGRPYFVMELVRGIKITDYCDQNNLSTEDRLKVFIQVCQAVQHAHQKGIIHRDIKPSNILVASHDGLPVPKVIDFGIAKATTDQRLTDKTLFTAFQQFIGTPAYMSPEQAEMSGLDIDTRTDVYSLGVLLYELLTGKTPFDQRTLIQAGLEGMRKIIREKEPARPSTRLSGLTGNEQTSVAKKRGSEPSRLIRLLQGDLDWVVMKCLEKERARRYETTNGLAADVQRHLANEPVVARPPSKLDRLQKLVQRNRLAVSAGAGLVVIFAAGLVAFGWEFIQKNKEKNRAVEAEMAQRELRKRAQIAEAASAEAAANARFELSNFDLREAVRLIVEDDCPSALAYLARSLSLCPTNGAASTRLVWLLSQHLWLVPTEAFREGEEASVAALSADGKLALTLSNDDSVRVWSVQSGLAVGEPFKHKGVRGLRMSPDGGRVVTASVDFTARVWSARTGEPLTPPLKHEGQVSSAEFSPDGKWVVTASIDKTARVWDALTGRPMSEPLKHEENVRSAQFSPDGKYILTVTAQDVRVWDALTGEAVSGPMRQPYWITSARFSPNGKLLVTGSGQGVAPASWNRPPAGEVRLWDALTGRPVGIPMKHSSRVTDVEFSPSGERIVTTSEDKTARVWDASSGEPVSSPMVHANVVLSGRFSPDGRYIVTSCANNCARIWDARTGLAASEPIGHQDRLIAAQFTADGARVITASTKTVAFWDALAGAALPQSIGTGPFFAQFTSDGMQILKVLPEAVQICDARTSQKVIELAISGGRAVSAQLSLDRRRILIALTNGVKVWDAQTGQQVAELETDGRRVVSAQLGPDGRKALMALTNAVEMWDARTNQKIGEMAGNVGTVVSAQLSPDGQRVLVTSRNAVRLWDAQTGEPITELLVHNGRILSAEFSLDGQRVVTGSMDKTAKVWSADGRLLESLVHGAAVHSARFSPDGRFVVTTGDDGVACVWDALTGQKVSRLSKGASRAVLMPQARFGIDGRLVLTVLHNLETRDCETLIWDRVTGQPVIEPIKHSEVDLPQLSVDGKRLMIGSRIWDIGPSPLSSLPEWIVPLTEAISGRLLSESGGLEFSTRDRAGTIVSIRRDLEISGGTDDWSTWGRWRLGNPATRTISPFSKITIPKNVEAWIEMSSTEILDEADRGALGSAHLQDIITRTRRIIEEAKRGGEFLADGRVTEAEQMYQDRLDSLRALVPSGGPQLALALTDLAHTLLGQQKFKEAESAARECQSIREDERSNEWLTFRACSLLGASLVGQSKLNEAEPLLLQGYHGLKERVSDIPGGFRDLVVASALANLVHLYTATDQSNRSAEELRQVIESTSWQLLNDLAWFLATRPNSYERDGSTARVLAERAVDLTSRKNANVLDTLAASYAESGDFAKAVATQREAIVLTKVPDNERTSRLRLYESHAPYRKPVSK